jgi:hypothetical protein
MSGNIFLPTKPDQSGELYRVKDSKEVKYEIEPIDISIHDNFVYRRGCFN